MTFTVRDFHDLIRLLEEHPEWRTQLLRVLFPEAFLTLPQAVEALAEAQRKTEAAIERLTERLEWLRRGGGRSQAHLGGHGAWLRRSC